MTSPSSVVDFVRNEIAAGTFPGASLLVHHQGRTVEEYFEGTYCSSTGRNNSLHAGVSHMLYSFSKGISATVVAIARRKGLIDYDAPLRAYLPDYRGEWKDEVTIRHLLNHTAGIPNCALKSVCTEELWGEALQTCYDAKAEWKPSSRSEYHAKSAMLLAAEAVRSQLPGRPSWEAICREWLLDPIGAETLTLEISPGPLALPPPPNDLPCDLNPSLFPHLGHPGSGFFGRLEDMIKVLQLHLNGGIWKGQVILDPEQCAEMHRVQYGPEILEARANHREPNYEPYGLGWKIKLGQRDDGFGLGNQTEDGAFGHAGVWTVFGMGIPRKQLAIAFISTLPPATLPVLARIRNGITDLIDADHDVDTDNRPLDQHRPGSESRAISSP